MTKVISSNYLAAVSYSFSATDPLSVNKTATTLFSSIFFYKSSACSTNTEAGPTFFKIQLTISCSVLPPVYSDGVPAVKNFRVGYPCTPYLAALAEFSVASTFAILIGGS